MSTSDFEGREDPRADERVARSEEALVRARVAELVEEHDPRAAAPEEFLGRQFDAGLAWVDFPVGRGGLGLSAHLQSLVTRLLLEAGAPSSRPRNPVGHGTAAPTIRRYGSEEQRRRYLRPIFTGEEIWCQLFSEPAAGSDLANLAARAERDGDDWVVTGEKVWVTLAHNARWASLVARTDPGAPKHRGITFFVLDMRAPGVEVRPLRQMTGDAEFNQVYLTEVRVPDSERLGEVDGGWKLMIETLMDERASIGGAALRRPVNPIDVALDLWRRSPRRDPARRDRLAQLWIESEVTRLTTLRSTSASRAGGPGPEGSVGKLAIAEVNQRVYELCLDIMGAEGMRYGSYEMTRPDEAMASETVQEAFLRSRANTIEGGTSEIMRNILAERVLHLPPERRVDKDVPWIDLPR